MKVHKSAPRFIRSSAPRLTALCGAMVTILLCASTALGQQCANNVSPGETFTFQQASSGGATPGAFTNGGGLAVGFAGGSDIPSQNKVEAAAVTFGLLAASANGFGQINYVFCVPGRRGDQVTAAISAQIQWYGILAGATIGSNVPSVTGSFNLIDLGTDGNGTNLVAGAAPLNGNLNTLQITPIFLNVNISGGITNGTVPVALQTQVTVGHMYAIEYNLDCHASTGLLLSISFCDFTNTLPTTAIPFTNLPPGDYHSEVDNLTVTLGPDQYGTILGIKAEVDALSAQTDATRNELAVTKLTLERENAQLLGILNEIKALLTALQSDPPISSTPAKAKTSDPKPPIRPVRPRTMDPP
jgi:hypothetical protein